MENQENNYNNEFVSETQTNATDEERAKKKKARILIIVELALLILVLLLAVIFFTNKEGGVNIFSRSSENPGVSNIEPNDNWQEEVIESEVNNQDNTNFPIVNNPGVSVPEGDNLQVVESVRLSLPVPEQSPVSSEDSIPAGAIKISGLESGFSPSEFRVSPGEEVTLALTSRIDFPVILTFYDANMPAISIGCGPQETRWVTFVAPQVKGEYLFKNDVFGRSEQTGVMIVE